MAHVVAFIPDLLFGSRVQAALDGGRSRGRARRGRRTAFVSVWRGWLCSSWISPTMLRRAGLVESLSADGLLERTCVRWVSTRTSRSSARYGRPGRLRPGGPTLAHGPRGRGAGQHAWRAVRFVDRRGGHRTNHDDWRDKIAKDPSNRAHLEHERVRTPPGARTSCLVDRHRHFSGCRCRHVLT